MGFYSTVTGEITVSPPITHAEVVADRANGKRLTSREHMNKLSESNYEAVYLATEELVTTEETPDGTVTTRRLVGTGIMPITDEEIKAYKIAENVRDIIAAFPGHQWSGYLHLAHEDGTQARVTVNSDGKVAIVEPIITWPQS